MDSRTTERLRDSGEDRLSSAETLEYFDLNAKTKVIADASPVELGAVFVQEKYGQKCVIDLFHGINYSLSPFKFARQASFTSLNFKRICYPLRGWTGKFECKQKNI